MPSRRTSRPSTTKNKAAAATGKIAPPRLANVYQRLRLFKALDKACARPVIWISAPAGAGKTTLAASYLSARKLPSLWYRFDLRDADPATFFYYLREAIHKHAPRQRQHLPLLTPEYLAGLPAFTRNFFDAFFARLGTPAVLVLDNFQELPEDAVLQSLIAHALSGIPQGVTVIVLSRTAPPPVVAALQAQQLLQWFDGESMQLTLEEARGIAQLHDGPISNARVLESLHAQVQGWTAGWILLLAHQQRGGSAPTDIPSAARDTLFQYFATELFERASPEVQGFLLKASYLPQVAAASAVVLTGDLQAPRILARLERQNYFTTRLSAAEPVYQFHPLFHEFLRTRSEHELPRETRHSLTRHAAQLLGERGQHEDAAALLIELKDWEALTRLALAQAPNLVQQGRHTTLESWLRALSAESHGRDPWVLFWLGVCRFPFDTEAAREILIQAYHGFEKSSDCAGLFLAWASIVETIVFEYSRATGLDRWIADLDGLMRRFPEFPSPQIEARVISAMFSALMFRQPQHPRMDHWIDRLRDIIERATDANERVLLGAHLCIYFLVWVGNLSAAERILGLIRPQHGVHLAPIAEVLWHVCVAHWNWVCCHHDTSIALATTGRRVADERGIFLWNDILYAVAADVHLCRSEPDAASPYVTSLEQLALPTRLEQQARARAHKAWLAAARGEYPAALRTIQEVWALHEQEGAPFLCVLSCLNVAQMLQANRQLADAAELATKALDLARNVRSRHLEYQALYLLAGIDLDAGRDAEGLFKLRTAFAFGRKNHYERFVFYFHRPDFLAMLCARALDADIETKYVRDMIRIQGLMPPSKEPVADTWPYRVKIHTLDRFAVLIDDKPLKFSGKAQKKPIELLKGLIAFGGREVNEAKLARALWPRAEDAPQALATTVHRLRKLIGEETIERKEGYLGLNPRHCWVDVWNLERQLTRVEAACQARHLSQIASLIEALLARYRRGFLEADADASWSSTYRERLRNRMLQQVASAAQVLSEASDPDRAIACYHKALEIDPLVESLYSGLMQTYLGAGRRAEARATYERCRRILEEQLGVTPNARTEGIAREIMAS